jgi:hypothetical protein
MSGLIPSVHAVPAGHAGPADAAAAAECGTEGTALAVGVRTLQFDTAPPPVLANEARRLPAGAATEALHTRGFRAFRSAGACCRAAFWPLGCCKAELGMRFLVFRMHSVQ